MRILVTNDDGINAPGLEVLEKIARKLSSDVWVVAPETEQSGAAHSLTLHMPVRLRNLSPRHFAVTGTPTDCVLMALQEVVPNASRESRGSSRVKNTRFATRDSDHVTLVLSGVNRGSNAADDVTYSGTVAAAMEGTILGVPSIALSLMCEDREKPRWEVAERHAPGLIKKLVRAGWPANALINVNFPDCLPGKVKGVRVCPQGKRLVGVALSERVDPKGRPYYWIGGDRENTPDRPGVDIDWLEKGYITVTPLCLDLTDYKTAERMRKILEG